MQFTDLHKRFLKYLQANTNPERAVKEKAYLYSDNKHYGLSFPLLERYFNSLNKEIISLSKSDALAAVKFLWNQQSHEEKMLALHILEIHANELEPLDITLIEELMSQSKGWVYLDNLIIPVMPQLLIKYKSSYKYLTKWIKDNDFWVRRSAMLAQLLLFRKGEGNKKLFYDFAESQFDESWIDEVYKDKLQRSRARFFIRKAIGWTIREISIKDPESAYTFLKANKERMSGLSFKEGSRKLPAKYKF